MSGRRKALIVASGEYDHEGLRQLLSPAADAEALAAVLGDPQIGEFDVQVVHDETAHVIQARIEDLFSESVPDDLLLVHLSCHGLKNDSGELFFAARNTRPNRLGSTAIPADFVRRCMRSSRSRRIVLFLDCCYGGAFGQGVAVRAAGDINVLDNLPADKLGGGRGRAVITASSSMEYALEGDRLTDDNRRQPSLFTSAVVEGLATGDADRDEDGWVSLNELYDYVFDRVREQNPNQTPSRDIEMQGELYVARSPRHRIRSSHIPAELQAAMANPNMFTRLGAVTELRSRLTSDNLQVAAEARDALAQIARTDIHHLAEAAATALSEVALKTAEQELHFGQIAQDASAPRRTVRLQGPALARTCTFEASGSWIQVTETTNGIRVSVDTSRVGKLRGDITITGPTGKAVIPVSAEIIPKQPPPPPATSAPPPTAIPRRSAASLQQLPGTGRTPAPPSTGTKWVSELDRLRRRLPHSRRARILTAVALLISISIISVIASINTAFAPFQSAPGSPPASAVPVVGADSIGDPYFPRAGNAGYDATAYDINVRYDPRTDQLEGHTTITARAVESLSRFNLDLRLLASTVTVNDQPAQIHQDDGELQITPAAPVPAGTPMTVRVDYAGVPSTIRNGPTGPSPWTRTSDGALAVNEPDIAPWWYPSNNHPSDKATFTITAVVPAGVHAISNGVLLGGPEPAGPGLEQWRWQESEPMATYLAFLAIGKYDLVRRDTRFGPYLAAYDRSLDPQVADAAKASVEQTPEIVEFLSGAFGPYPFHQLGGVVPNAPALHFALAPLGR